MGLGFRAWAWGVVDFGVSGLWASGRVAGYVGVSETRGPKHSTLNSRILTVRTQI